MDRNATIHPDALELAELLRPSWASTLGDLRSSGALIAAGDDDDPDKGDKDGKVTIDKSEHDELKRTIAEKDREARDAKKAQKEAEDRISALEAKVADAEAGDDEAKKLTARLDRLETKASDAEKRANEAEAKLEQSGKERDAMDVAARLGFRNPARAIRLLDSDDLDTKASAETALERLKREEPGLIATKKQREVTDPERETDPGGGGDPEKDEPKRKDRNGDEPTGQARIAGYYEEQAKKAEREAAAAGAD